MKPFEIQWQNRRGGTATNWPWVSFVPAMKVIAPDEVSAVRYAVERRLTREPHLRAIEIPWSDYMG